MTSPSKLPLAGKRVLIVDDQPDALVGIVQHLRAQGMDVVCASDWHEMMARVQKCPDIILLDVVMQWVDGFEAYRRLKERGMSDNIPVLFMSGTRVEDADRAKGFELGADDYLVKPLLPAEVLARIATRLRVSEARADASRLSQELSKREYQRAQAETTLQETLDDAVIIVSAAGEALFCSAAAKRLLREVFPTFTGKQVPSELLTRVRVGRIRIERSQKAGAAGAILIKLRADSGVAGPERLRVLGLTPREAEILFWVTQGKTTPEIEIILGISGYTVKEHIHHVLEKLGVETRLAAALRAREILRRPDEEPGEGVAVARSHE